jgi:eukaryotic-like serine/threonine-protein kinase
MTEAPLEGRRPDVPGYRIERVLGRGGFGVVYAAVDAAGRGVALKVATAGDATAAAQLAREESALRAVGPPVAPALLGSGKLADGSPYLALELLQPPTLADRLHEIGGPMKRAEFAGRAAALCDAVGAVHSLGFLHLDLKPQNVFLEPGGVRLIDFGIARPLRERRVRGTSFAGTPEYASPEQCEERPELDARADLYALGVLLFEMLTGRPPFAGDAQAVRDAHIGVRPPRPSQLAPVTAAVEEVILHALNKDRTRRYASAAELKAALQGALAAEAPAEEGRREVASPLQPRLERRQVGVLLFASTSDAGSVQAVVRSLGGELGWTGRGRYAAIFPGEAGQDPVRRAFRAAQELADRKLAVRPLVDLGAVNAQRRPDGQVRYLAPELGREDRYATEADPVGPLATAAAAEVLADVGWEPVPGRQGLFVPRPGAAGRVRAATVVQLGAGPLVGREDVLRDLLAAASDAAQGTPAVMTVIAEPGHGKTHLAAALLEKLGSHLPAAERLDLRAREPIAGDAEETLRALLARALDLPPGAGEESARARFAAAVGAEMPAELWAAAALTLRLVSPDATQVRALASAPGVLRSMAMRAAGEAVRARARRRPLCLVLDDAQFADDTALDALEYAALAEAGAPLFVCALARPSFAEARKSFGERAARQGVHRIGPLQPARAAELCRRLLAPAENVPQAAVDSLVQRTHGIPLLLVELIRGLKRDGLVRKRMRGDSWFLATDELEKLPDSPLIEWLAEREVGALPRELASHARLTALLGSEFAAQDVEGVVAELDAEGLGAEFPLDAQVATQRLAALGILVMTRAGGFRFRHALVRDAVAQSVHASRREPVHRAAARFYRTTRTLPDIQRLPLLARHAAEAGLKDEAAALYLQLAEEARGRHSYLDAERSYTSALQHLDGAEVQRRLVAHRGRGSMRYRIGRYEDSLADFQEARAFARRLGDTTAEAEILLDAATALDWVSEFARSGAMVAEAAVLVQAAPSNPLRARLLLGKGRALIREDRWAEACAALEEAVRLAETVGDEAYETLIISLVLLEAILGGVGRFEDAERISERAVSLSQQRGDQLHFTAAVANRRAVRIARQDFPGAIEDQQTMVRMGRELGFPLGEYSGECEIALLHYQAGDLEAAAQYARRAMAFEDRHPDVVPSTLLATLTFARILAYAGRDAEAREMLRRLERAVRAAPPEGQAPGALTPSQAVLVSMVDLATRDASSEEWQALLERSARDSMEQEPIEVADLYGTWALRRGRIDEARRAFEEAVARAARIPNVMELRVRKGLQATAARTT